MGQFETSINGLVGAKNSGFQLQKKGKTTGDILVHAAEVSGIGGKPKAIVLAPDVPIEEMRKVTLSPSAPPLPSAPSTGNPTFTEYIAGGCEINLSVAIDFTGSNGDPRQPGTLHYMHKDGQKNDYQKVS